MNGWLGFSERQLYITGLCPSLNSLPAAATNPPFMSIRNNVSLIGNVGQTPTVTTFENGTILTEFSLATNDNFRDSKGERRTRTEWHRIKAFGKPAEVLGQWLNKGSQVALEGRLHYNKWTDKHGQNRVTTEIIVDDFTFLGSRNEAAPSQAEVKGEAAPQNTMDVNDSGARASATKPVSSQAKAKDKQTEQYEAARAKAKASALAILEDEELPF